MAVAERMRRRLERRSAIREAYESAGRLRRSLGDGRVFDMSIGSPSAPCPAGVSQALSETAAQAGAACHTYMDAEGYREVREAVAASLRRRFSTPYTPEDIVMTTGAACALNIAMQALIDPGDEMVVFRPYYPAYEAFALNWEAKVVKVPFADGYLPDVEAFRAALSEHTKIVLVNLPNNPSGCVWPPETARAVAEAMADAEREYGHEIYLLSDEPYRELAWDGARTPWWPDLYADSLVAYSFSKSASIAGERIGYLALSPGLSDKSLVRRAVLRSLGDLGFVNAPATSQRMALRCVDDAADLSLYDRNRRALYDALCAACFNPHLPQGAFYMLLPAPDGDEQELLDRLVSEGIVAVGGSEFGCPGTVRLSFCVSEQTLEGSLPHFARVARTYGLCPADAQKESCQ